MIVDDTCFSHLNLWLAESPRAGFSLSNFILCNEEEAGAAFAESECH
jgi:hypothetical protein